MADQPSDLVFGQPDPATIAALNQTKPEPEIAIPAAKRTARETNAAPAPASAERGYGDTYGGGRGADATTNQALKIANAPTEGGPNFFDKYRHIIIPALTGVGAMASSDSRYLGSALLQGLGAGAQAYGKERDDEIKLAQGALKTGEQGTNIRTAGETAAEINARTAGERAANWQKGIQTEIIGGVTYTNHLWDLGDGSPPVKVRDGEEEEFQRLHPNAFLRDPNKPVSVQPTTWASPSRGQSQTPAPVVAPAAPKAPEGAPVERPPAPTIPGAAAPLAPAGGDGARVFTGGPGKVTDLLPGVLYPQNAVDTDVAEKGTAPGNKDIATAGRAARVQSAANARAAMESDSRLHSYAQHVADSIAKGQGGYQGANIATAYSAYAQVLRQLGYKEPIPQFTDAKSASEFMTKNSQFLGTASADAAGQHANEARQALAASLPNMDMQPETRAAMMAQLLVDQQRTKELDSAYKYSSTKAPGMNRTYENVPGNYNEANKDRNFKAKQQLTQLMLHPKPFSADAFSGKYTAAEIERKLSGGGDPKKAMPGYDPSLQISRYFPHRPE